MDLRLPHDIFLEILSKLPIKSLIRCKSVSKTWNLHTRHPLLPYRHLSQSPHPTYFILNSLINENNKLYSLDFDSQTLTDLNLPFESTSITILSSCNGLLCLLQDSADSHEIFICNPFTSDYFHIPNSDPDYFSYGFGFDPKTQKYKLVQILSRKHQSCRFTISVYTIGGPEWTPSKDVNGMKFGQCSPGVYVNGALHWKGYKEGENKPCIIYFDLGTEEFGAFPFPNLSDDLKSSEVSLMAFGRHISALYKTVEHGFCITIWLMNDYGVEDSWVKLFQINDSPVFLWGIEIAKLLCYNKNGEFVLLCGSKQLVSYDPVRGSYRDLGLNNTLESIVGVPHIASIISPGN